MTTEYKHTPGPWHVGTKEAHHCVYDARGWQIADASPLGKSDDTKANARLIAAAPDLLSALEKTLSWLTSYPGEGALKAYEQAQAAIAKATGKGAV